MDNDFGSQNAWRTIHENQTNLTSMLMNFSRLKKTGGMFVQSNCVFIFFIYSFYIQ